MKSNTPSSGNSKDLHQLLKLAEQKKSYKPNQHAKCTLHDQLDDLSRVLPGIIIG